MFLTFPRVYKLSTGKQYSYADLGVALNLRFSLGPERSSYKRRKNPFIHLIYVNEVHMLLFLVLLFL